MDLIGAAGLGLDDAKQKHVFDITAFWTLATNCFMGMLL